MRNKAIGANMAYWVQRMPLTVPCGAGRVVLWWVHRQGLLVGSNDGGNGIKKLADWGDRLQKIGKGFAVVIAFFAFTGSVIFGYLDGRYASAQALQKHAKLLTHPGVNPQIKDSILPMIEASKAAQRTASSAAGQANAAKKLAEAAQETAAFGICKQAGGWVQSISVPTAVMEGGLEVVKNRVVRACTFLDPDGTKESASLLAKEELLLLIQRREQRAFERAVKRNKRRRGR
jgi:hypothetical protein